MRNNWQLFCLLFLTHEIYAANSYNKFTLNLQNHSPLTLTYVGVSGINSTNSFSAQPKVLKPAGTIQIIGHTSCQQDLAGNLHFVDANNKQYSFIIINYRHFHEGQSIFNLNSMHLATQLTKKEWNRNTDPMALDYWHVAGFLYEKP